MENPATSMGWGSIFRFRRAFLSSFFSLRFGRGRRIDGVLVFRDVDGRKDLEVVGRGFAAAQIEAEELGVIAALGEEEDGGAVGRPLRVVFAALVGGRREGELAGLVGAGAGGWNEPEMACGAVGGGMRDGEEHLLAVGREHAARKELSGGAGLRWWESAERLRRGCCRSAGLRGEKRGTEGKQTKGKSQPEAKHGVRIQRRSGVGGVSVTV